VFCVDVLRLLFDLLAFEFVVLKRGTVSCWGFKSSPVLDKKGEPCHVGWFWFFWGVLAQSAVEPM
jgi:hypothetical protein